MHFAPRFSLALVGLVLLALDLAPAWAVPVNIRVVDAQKNPIAGASISYSEFDDRPIEVQLEEPKPAVPQQVVVGADGTLALDLKEPVLNERAKALLEQLTKDKKSDNKAPMVARARVRAPGYAFADTTLHAGANEIVLLPEAIMRGLVKDVDGKPLEGARVRLQTITDEAYEADYTYFDSDEAGPETASGTDGSWQLGELPAQGIATVEISAPQRATARFQAWLEGAANEAPAQKLRLGGVVRGRVVDEKGAGVAGVSMFLQSGGYGAKPSDKDGNFVIEGLSVGVGTLNFWNQGGQWFPPADPVTYAISAQGGDIDLGALQSGRGTLVSGVIVDKATKKPVPDLEINLSNRKAKTDANGRFKGRIGNGYFQLEIKGDYATVGERNFVEISKSAETYDMGEVTVEPAFSLPLQILDEKGEAIMNTTLMFQGEGGRSDYAQFDGEKMSIGPLQPGEYKVKGYGAWEVVEPKKATIAAKTVVEPLTIRLRKKPTVTLSGRVVDGKGAPLGNVELKIGAATGEDRWQSDSALSRGDGTWKTELSQPEVEPQVRSVERPLYAKLSGGEVTRAGEAWKSADIVMARADAQLSGRVVNADGSPVAGAALRWSGAQPNEFARSDAKGAFALNDLPDAPLKVQVSDGPRLLETALIEPGEIFDIALPIAPEKASVEALWQNNDAPDIRDLERYFDIVGAPRMLEAARRADAKDAKNAGKIGPNLDAYLGMIAARNAPGAAREGVALVGALDIESAEGAGAAQLARLAARSDDETARAWAQRWFDAQKVKIPTREANREAINDALRVASVGAALELDEALSYRDLALVFIDRNKNDERGYYFENWGGLLWQIKPQWFEEALNEWAPIDRLSALSGATKEIKDAAQSRALVERIEKLAATPEVIKAEAEMKQKQPYRESMRERALDKSRIHLAQALAATDPAAAIIEAEKVTKGYQIQGVALEIARAAIASNQPATARAALRLGLKDSYMGRMGAAPLALLAQSFDADVARELLASMESSIFESDYHDQDYLTVAYYAMALRDSDPGRARLLLEAEWERRINAKTDGNDRWNRASRLHALARAMALYDVERALQRADKAGKEGGGNKTALIALALASRAERPFVINDNDRF